MKNKVTTLIASAALALGMSAGAQAQTFSECASTSLVNFDGTIVDAAVATPALSTLVDAVTAAGLGDALATTENITVFAPTNDAFAALPAPLLDAALADTDLLTGILTYHVTTGHQDPRKFPGAVSVARDTLQGQSIYFTRADGQPRVNNAGVVCEGVRASNGIVFVIDSVLLPNL
ncbi:fasciclin domain-containing protein [Pseudohalioglobus sediminis]|uniref:Fasciclin domain-containing protein n=1 Tax=Pseudohalioglobus sediminis TaxID=2606449 RepID=A0A5B0WYE8_9GAMM|nr:fasciclin domain-containing protein [Pseudohalioglobus sediminis]KAA1192016.1 fasciclin domain-containing protein [Pseudohalioglobus sediminis]